MEPQIRSLKRSQDKLGHKKPEFRCSYAVGTDNQTQNVVKPLQPAVQHESSVIYYFGLESFGLNRLISGKNGSEDLEELSDTALQSLKKEMSVEKYWLDTLLKREIETRQPD